VHGDRNPDQELTSFFKTSTMFKIEVFCFKTRLFFAAKIKFLKKNAMFEFYARQVMQRS